MAESDSDPDNPNCPVTIRSPDDPGAEVKITKKMCTYCDKTFSTVGSLNKHIGRIHGIKTIKETMECLSCENKFTQRMKLVEHLKSDHGQDFEVEMLEFKTSDEFERWRAEEERDSVAMFRNVICDRPSKNGTTTILVCTRDGQARSDILKKRQRALKSQGSRKIGHTCTSHMVVNKVVHPEKKVIVTYVKTHYGHEPEIQHLNLSLTDKEELAKKLRPVQETKEACGRPTNLLSRPTNSGSDLKKDFVKFVRELSSYEDRFDEIPLTNQKEIVRFLRTATILCKEESCESFKENKLGEKMNGCKRKISKQEEFCNKVKQIKEMKKKKKKMSTEPSPSSSKAFASELQINEYAPWVDCPVDHEEVI